MVGELLVVNKARDSCNGKSYIAGVGRSALADQVTVQRLGGLWTVSCYNFEGLNSRFTRQCSPHVQNMKRVFLRRE